MHFADFVGFACVIQDTLSRRGFTRVDVRHNPDIAIHMKWMAACHDNYSEVKRRLPAVMAECAVGFGHPVRIFTLFHGVAAIVRRIKQLA